MKTKFTKELRLGYPSVNEPNKFVISDADGIVYAEVYGANGSAEEMEESEANARLFVAAPGLLKLAVDFCSTFESTIGYQKYDVNVFKVLNDRYIQAKSAIKKATE